LVNKSITIPQLSKKIGINVRNTKNNVAKLKEMNLLEREGNNKSGGWKIVVT
jgi:predicted HTH transcriptional regulator